MKKNFFLILILLAIAFLFTAPSAFAQSNGFDCSTLEPDIVTTEIELCIPGEEVTLEADLDKGDQIRWYDSSTSADHIHKGTKLELGFVDETVSYWVTEVKLEEVVYLDEQGMVEPMNPIGVVGVDYASYYGLQFDVEKDFTLHNVDVYPKEDGDLEISLFDNSGNLIDSVVETVSSSPSDPITIVLNFEIEEGKDYRLVQTSDPLLFLISDLSALLPNPPSGSIFPHKLGDNGEYGAITTGTWDNPPKSVPFYHYFFNWEIGVKDILCESDREEIVITVSDEIPDPFDIDPTYVLCGDDDFTLEDVVIDGNDAQWYDELGDELDLDTPVVDGVTYYLARKLRGCISDLSSITIDVLDYSDLPIAAIEQTFEEGETLGDLEVDGDNLRWYADSDKTEELLENTELLDGETYYVTQTLSGLCESEVLEISVVETLSIDDLSFENIKFSPNPVIDVLFLVNVEELEGVEVYDITGRVLLKRSVQNSLSEMEIDLTGYSAGMYFLNLTKEGKSKVIRIIKK